MNGQLLHGSVIFFVSSGFYQQFLELCVTSYPSPLEESAPRSAKLLLFCIAGAYEYIAALRDSGLLDATINLAARPLCSGAWPWELSDIFLRLILARNFARRARSFTRCASRNGRGVTARSVLMAFVLHNPALVCHVACREGARRFGVLTVGMFVPKMLWELAYPTTYSAMSLTMAALIGACSMALYNGVVVKHVPKLLTSIALTTQNRVFYSTEQKKMGKTLENNKNFKERKRSLIELALQNYLSRFSHALYMVESLVSSIQSNALELTTTATDMILDGLANQYYIESSQPSSIHNLLLYGAQVLYMFATHVSSILTLFAYGQYPESVSYDDKISSDEMRRLTLLNLFVTRVSSVYRHYTESPQLSSVQYPADPSSDHICILTLLPSARPSDPIRTLRHWYPITNTPPYTAISYSWRLTHTTSARTVATPTIDVDEVSTSVTRSAYTALRELRSPFRPRMVWLDQICIDQECNDDKNRQIPLMPRIYAQAAAVTIWLGPSKTAHLATALVNRLFIVNRLSYIDSRFKYEIDVEAARALKRMLRCRWFRRTWVAQEIVRARGKVTVRYGAARLEWTRLRWFMQSLLKDEALLRMLDERIGYTGLGVQGTMALENVEVIRKFALVKGGDPSLSLQFYLLQMFRSKCQFACTNKWDRVYALLGLPEASLKAFKPKSEYESDQRQLFIDVVHHLLDTSPPANRLDFLSHAGKDNSHSTPGLPSWAPDWSVNPTSQQLFGTDGSSELLASSTIKELLKDAAVMASVVYTDQDKQQKDLYLAALDKGARVKDQILALLFDATKGMEPYARILDGSVLEVRVRMLGPVKIVGGCYKMPESQDSPEALRTLREWVRLALKTAQGYGPRRPESDTDSNASLAIVPEAAQAAAQSFAEVLCGGVSNGQIDYTFMSAPQKLDPTFAKLTEGLFKEMIRIDHFEREVMQHYHNIIPTGQVEAVDNARRDVLKPYSAAVGQTCTGKRFGIAKYGRMGLFPGALKGGDEVGLVAGAKVPFVLREVKMVGADENKRCFELVGPAFVKGIMYGEGLNGDEGFELIRIR
jgi:hypothetical protein